MDKPQLNATIRYARVKLLDKTWIACSFAPNALLYQIFAALPGHVGGGVPRSDAKLVAPGVWDVFRSILLDVGCVLEHAPEVAQDCVRAVREDKAAREAQRGAKLAGVWIDDLGDDSFFGTFVSSPPIPRYEPPPPRKKNPAPRPEDDYFERFFREARARRPASPPRPPPAPPPPRQLSDWQVLGLMEGAPIEVVKAAHRVLLQKHHPDLPGGDAELAKRINNARDNILKLIEGKSP